MNITVLQYLVISVVLTALLLAYFRLARHFNIIDRPNERSSHRQPTIRGGGIVFPVAVVLWFLFDGFQQPWAMGGLFAAAAVSLFDDLRGMPRSLRFLVHLVAVSLLFVQMNVFGLPWYFLLAAYILAIGWINAFNFMDGINAITPFYALTALAAFGYLAYTDVVVIPGGLVVVLVISLLVFSWFNARRHALTFAGDVGSISMAYVLAWLMITLMIQTRDFSWILLFAVYGIDSVITIMIRLRRGENIFKAHRSHLYQLLANEHGWPHLKVAGIYAFVQLTINAISIYLIIQNQLTVSVFAGILAILSLAYLLIRRSLS